MHNSKLDTSHCTHFNDQTQTNEYLAYLCHNQVLTLAVVLALRLDDRLQEAEVVHLTSVRLDARDEVADHLLRHLVTQLHVVEEDGAHRLRLQKLQRNAS